MSLAAIPMAIQVLVAALAGYGVGTVHFRSLARVADMMLAGRMLAVVLQLARLAVLTGFLVLAALAGPTPLIAAVISMLVARARVLKAARP
jgi:hypothetical protein